MIQCNWGHVSALISFKKKLYFNVIQSFDEDKLIELFQEAEQGLL